MGDAKTVEVAAGPGSAGHAGPRRRRRWLGLVPRFLSILTATAAMLAGLTALSGREDELVDLIRVDRARKEFKVDGKGFAVAVLDTGLNVAHLDFAGDGRIPARRNFTNEEGGAEIARARAAQAKAQVRADEAGSAKAEADKTAAVAKAAVDRVAAVKEAADRSAATARAAVEKAAPADKPSARKAAADAEDAAKKVADLEEAGAKFYESARAEAAKAAAAALEAARAVAVAKARGDELAANDVSDGNGHGSHVGGIVVAQGRHAGIAPGANIVPVKIVSANGGADIASINRGLRWVLDNHERYNISVVLLALGDLNNYPDDDAAIRIRNPADRDVLTGIRETIRKLRAARVATVAAAGNRWFYFNAKDKPGPTEPGMCQPGIFGETISVGAVYDRRRGAKTYPAGGSVRECIPGRITPFSQRLHDGPCRTDVFAPGGETHSTGKDGLDTESIEQGTAQASAVTAGVVLLLQDYYAKANRGKLPSVDQLEDWVRRGSVPTEDRDDGLDDVKHTGAQFPRLDAWGALKALRDELMPKGAVTGA